MKKNAPIPLIFLLMIVALAVFPQTAQAQTSVDSPINQVGAQLIPAEAPVAHEGSETLKSAPMSPSYEDMNRLMTPGGQVFHRTANPVSDLRTLFVPDTTIQLYLWNERIDDGDLQAHYAIGKDGMEITGRVRPTTYLVRLSDIAFDPMTEDLAIPTVLAARNHNHLFFVQFQTTILPEFRTGIENLGTRVLRFLTDHTYIVEMTPAMRDQVKSLPHVRSVTPYHPVYRLEKCLRDALLGVAPELEEQRYSIMVCKRGDEQQNHLSSRILSLGGIVHLTTSKGFRVEATLTHDQLLEVAHANEVHYIDRWGGPGETDMNVVRQNGGADYIEGLLGWTGQGVRGEIFDTELLTSHQEWLYTPIIHSNGTSMGSLHGTSCYSNNFARGASASARGICPDGQGIFYLYNESTQFGGSKSRYDINAELMDPGGIYRAVFQTASVGSSRTTSYTTISAETDDYLFQYPVLSTQSQSNAGSQMSRPQAWAKNIVAVGAMYHQGTADRSDDSWSSGASIGPASDGRLKPDLSFYYDNIYSASGSGSSSYTQFGGTSSATPQTSGHFGMFFKMWHEGVWSGFGGGASVFDSRPEMATAKAVVINTAYRYDWNSGGSNSDITRHVQGWGTADLQRMYDRASLTTIIDESDVITALETKTYDFTVGAGQSELNVTMAYTDPMGTVGAAEQRINDLTLKVTSPSSTVYWGNNGLTVDNTSSSGGSSNTVDTVENVFIVNPAAGAWTVQVIADEIVQDSHTETGAVDADFALVVYGATPGGQPDTTPPNPDPMTWAGVPAAASDTSITMTATTATDPSGVQYYFDCLTAGGHDSGWQSSATYVDTGLTASTSYTYRVKARDMSANQNETAYSSQQAATTDPEPDTTAPDPDPMTWATAPYATGQTSIAMVATTATDPSGVQYYFDCLTAGGHDSGWQSSSSYEDTGLSPDTTYTYQVRARDMSPNQNMTAYSGSAAATTDPAPPDVFPPDPDPMTWATAPYATGSSSISMTATTANDPSGVEYYFDCLTAGGNDSGWQDSATYEDTGLSPDTTYTYQVKARDKSINQNETGYSSQAAATTDPHVVTYPSISGNNGYEYIARVQIGGIDNSTGGDPSGYGDYTGISTNMMVGTSTSCTLTPGFPGSTYNENWKVWIDFNVDGDFADAGEEVFYVVGGSTSVSGTITVPAGSAPVTTRMRVVMKWNGTPPSSGDIVYGEAEDYTVNIVEGTPDLDPPNPDPMTWASEPASAGQTSITMTATTATDPSGVEYYFDCLTAGGNDSGWQSGTTYVDTGLSPDTTYTYRVMARDLSANQNETGYSSSVAATTDPPAGWVELTYDDFEAGWGNYVDGGGDCRRRSTSYSHQGSYSANIQDNSGVASSFYYGNGVDVHTAGYTQIKVEFWFQAISMDNSNEDFWVQYYDGSTWHTVATYARSIDFENGIFYNETVYINESSYTFPTDMKIRFMCDASGNRDDVYIDEISVSAQ